ncbi:transport system permease protein [Rhodopseudomonas palustris BisB5]|uniref:Transport system permease protein n=1 Tax=Rhodopseudomonas palustris (strain BisB5) TaxID=316057 RepID=Q137N0_RHOPS|nr:transport system permease protein [Rhodopseudomonas palustris BisB5]
MASQRITPVVIALAVGLAFVVVIAAGTGPYPIAPGEVIAAMLDRLTGGRDDGQAAIVLFQVRLPRIAAAICVGAALAAAGAAYQCLFRNPLVSPDILGVSHGAGFGAVIGILFGFPIAVIELMGFVTGSLTVVLVSALAWSLRERGDILMLVLAGIVVGAIAAAAISLVKIVADPYSQLPMITYWLLGSLASIRPEDLAVVIPTVAVGLVPLFLLRWRIAVLSLGDDDARALGVDARRTRQVVIAAATLITASVVAVSGVIGWVGLMVPHLARLLVGPRFDRLLPVSILLGAAFMVVVDTLARTIARIEIPIGVLTALVGGGLFVWLITRHGTRALWRRE